MDGELYVALRKDILDRIEFESRKAREMMEFVSAFVQYVNNSVGRTWKVCELGTLVGGTFIRKHPEIEDRSTLPFALAITFAHKEGGGGRAYGQEFTVVVPFVISWYGHSFQLKCLLIDEPPPEFPFADNQILAEANELLGKAVTKSIREYIDRT
jgi:hypothetical protein